MPTPVTQDVYNQLGNFVHATKSALDAFLSQFEPPPPIPPPPTASIVLSPAAPEMFMGPMGLKVDLSDCLDAAGGADVTVALSFGTMSVGPGAAPVAAYYDAAVDAVAEGQHTMTVTATDSTSGTTATASATFTVGPASNGLGGLEVFVP